MSFLLRQTEEQTKALQSLEKVATKPWYKKYEFWIGVVANIIALFALIRTF